MTYQDRFNINADQTSRLLNIHHYLKLYNLQGFANGYQLRLPKHTSEVEKGILQARRDWATNVHPVESKSWGCENKEFYSWSDMTLQLAKPERLRVCSYLFEFAFLYDDLVLEDNADTVIENTCATEALGPVTRSRSATTPIKTKKQILQATKTLEAEIRTEIMQIDPVCGKILFSSWRDMLLAAAARDKEYIYENYDDYIRWRLLDAGALFTGMVMLFAMGIQLTDEQKEIADKVLEPCYTALILSNDYFSFDKEWEVFSQVKDKDKKLGNAIWLFMQWNDLSIDAAKKVVRDLIFRAEAEFLRVRNEFLDKAPSHFGSLVKYIDQFYYLVPGNTLWGRTCPRYNKEYRIPLSSVGVRDKPARRGSQRRHMRNGPYPPKPPHTNCPQRVPHATDPVRGSLSALPRLRPRSRN
ncbi:hypothetical protein TWF694_005507 [Orbilia ellipsospora]|uniref:Terpene synthase n=1 Tax=Orbilia ellipsospora TaxID=2528407 RepID=A0AAV9WZD0_9PEZI